MGLKKPYNHARTGRRRRAGTFWKCVPLHSCPCACRHGADPSVLPRVLLTQAKALLNLERQVGELCPEAALETHAGRSSLPQPQRCCVRPEGSAFPLLCFNDSGLIQGTRSHAAARLHSRRLCQLLDSARPIPGTGGLPLSATLWIAGICVRSEMSLRPAGHMGT